MPWRNNHFLADLLQWLNTYATVIFGFFLAVLLSIFSTAKKHGKIDWLEALICGGLTVAIASILNYINLPNQLAIFIGGFIGFKGSLWVEEKFNQEYHRRYPPPNYPSQNYPINHHQPKQEQKSGTNSTTDE